MSFLIIYQLSSIHSGVLRLKNRDSKGTNIMELEWSSLSCRSFSKGQIRKWQNTSGLHCIHRTKQREIKVSHRKEGLRYHTVMILWTSRRTFVPSSECARSLHMELACRTEQSNGIYYKQNFKKTHIWLWRLTLNDAQVIWKSFCYRSFSGNKARFGFNVLFSHILHRCLSHQSKLEEIF